jgi:hypothetical protein
MQFIVEPTQNIDMNEIMRRAAEVNQRDFAVTVAPVRRRRFRRMLVCVTIKSPALARLSRDPSALLSMSPFWAYARWICGYGGSIPPDAPRS